MEEALETLKRNEGLVNPSSPTSESTVKVNSVHRSSVSFSHDTIFVGILQVPISVMDLRLLTKKGYT